MSKKRSFLGNLGLAVLGDILLFITVILLMITFSLTSFFDGYMLALLLIVGIAISIFFYHKHQNKELNDIE